MTDQTCTLGSLGPGEQFTVADGYLAPGGSSDAGVLTVARHEASVTWTEDNRTLPAMIRVRPVGA